MKNRDDNKFYVSGYIGNDNVVYEYYFKKYDNSLKHLKKLKKLQSVDNNILYVADIVSVRSFADEAFEVPSNSSVVTA